jgi:hypothetical protein
MFNGYGKSDGGNGLISGILSSTPYGPASPFVVRNAPRAKLE